MHLVAKPCQPCFSSQHWRQKSRRPRLRTGTSRKCKQRPKPVQTQSSKLKQGWPSHLPKLNLCSGTNKYQEGNFGRSAPNALFLPSRWDKYVPWSQAESLVARNKARYGQVRRGMPRVSTSQDGTQTTQWTSTIQPCSRVEVGTSHDGLCSRISEVAKGIWYNLADRRSFDQISSFLASSKHRQFEETCRDIHPRDSPTTRSSIINHFRPRPSIHVQILEELARNNGHSTQL